MSQKSNIDKDSEDLALVSWVDVVNPLVDGLAEEDIPENVIRCTELLLSGWPLYKIAKELQVRQSTIKGWLQKYPQMALVIKNGQKLLQRWRLAKLEQQFITAVEKSEKILNTDWMSDEDSPVNPKVLATVAQQARYIIDLFTGKMVDVTVQSSDDGKDATLSATQEALQYIVDQVKKIEVDREKNTIDAEYTIVEKTKSGNDKPMFDAEGKPSFGIYGVLEKDKDGTLCHICGKRYKMFEQHVRVNHDIPSDVYEITFGINDGEIKKLDKSNESGTSS